MADESKNSYSPNKESKGDGRFEEYKRFLWNPDTREFLSRTGESWLKIIVFYIFFFAALISFFYLLLWIFLQTLEDKKPKWIGNEGLIGSRPGMGFRPVPDQGLDERSPLIQYRLGKGKGSEVWSNKLEEFLEKQSNKRPLCESKSSASTGTCNKANNWGYPDGKPCILLKLNKIYGWIPEPYNSTDKDGFPSDMPGDLQSLIISSDADPKIWFSCNGTKKGDKKNLGKVEYFPEQGISKCHYPYENQDDYRAPFIFLQLSNPTYNVSIDIDCVAWAKNIRQSSFERHGLVNFTVLIDES